MDKACNDDADKTSLEYDEHTHTHTHTHSNSITLSPSTTPSGGDTRLSRASPHLFIAALFRSLAPVDTAARARKNPVQF